MRGFPFFSLLLPSSTFICLEGFQRTFFTCLNHEKTNVRSLWYFYGTLVFVLYSLWYFWYFLWYLFSIFFGICFVLSLVFVWYSLLFFVLSCFCFCFSLFSLIFFPPFFLMMNSWIFLDCLDSFNYLSGILQISLGTLPVIKEHIRSQ